jgi:hypothetical protein
MLIPRDRIDAEDAYNPETVRGLILIPRNPSTAHSLSLLIFILLDLLSLSFCLSLSLGYQRFRDPK